MRTTLLLLALLLGGCEQTAQSQQAGGGGPLSVNNRSLEQASDEISGTRRTAITRAVETASPAVVSVNIIELREVRVRDPFAAFFGRRVPDRIYQQPVQGLGSGFIISPDGYIVTNDHVAGNATKITIAFSDGSQLPARLVGSDPQTDIALLKVDPEEPLPYLAFEESGDAVVGEWAIALGNPYGLFEAAEPTVTVGVVSAIGRDFPTQQGRTFRDMIQTDAAINSGNSGGPLVNALGHVMGMNTFIYTQSGGSVGLGFAVPAWRVRQVVEELRARGVVDRSFYTGLRVNPVTPSIARALDMDEARGLIVRSIDEGSPAEQAGLRPYDVIYAVGGEPISSNEDIQQRLLDNRAGDVIRLVVLRNGREVEVDLRLAEQPG